MLFSLRELIDVIAILAFMGYFFMDIFKRPKPAHYDPLLDYKKGFRWEDFKFAALTTAPAIIFHELGHKLVALYFGLQASFHAAYMWLGIGLLMKLMNFHFIFFVPAYVSHSGAATPLEISAISFAGPFVNLLLFAGAYFMIKYRVVHRKYHPFLHLTKVVNLFLFVLNMIPLPFFDGSKVFSGLIQTFF